MNESAWSLGPAPRAVLGHLMPSIVFFVPSASASFICIKIAKSTKLWAEIQIRDTYRLAVVSEQWIALFVVCLGGLCAAYKVKELPVCFLACLLSHKMQFRKKDGYQNAVL